MKEFVCKLFALAVVLLIAILPVISLTVQAQNVSNPSFESFTTCPSADSQMNLCNGWSQPTDGTCDYFNTCGFLPNPEFTSTIITPPTGLGNGFAGMYPESTTAANSNYKEYLTNTLSSTLVAGKIYIISFWVRAVDPGIVFAGQGSLQDLPVAERGYLGLCFSSTMPTSSNTDNGSNGSIVNSFGSGRVLIPASSPVYTNHTWTQVVLQYTAVGGEQYMTVGQFRPGNTSMTVPSGLSSAGSYFYIDGFSDVLPCLAGITAPTLSATTISNTCPTMTVDLSTITATNTPASTTLTWHSGTPATTANKLSSITALTAGTYYAAFYDATNDCYSGTGSVITPVTATILSCPGAGTIDCAKTKITPAPVAGTASQVDLIVTVNVTTPGSFSLTVSGSGMGLANGVTSVQATTTGLQTFHIPLNYSGAALGTLNFTIGSTGSCSADLTQTPKKEIVDSWTLDCVPTTGPGFK